LNARIDFAKEDLDEPTLRDCLVRSQRLLHDMPQQSIALIEQSPNSVTPIFVLALNQLGDMNDERLAAEENRIPTAIWIMVALISVLTCLVTGYSMRRNRDYPDLRRDRRNGHSGRE
jgi:hypothetical protein